MGPTAAGKTAVGIRIAKAMGSAVISGDAYQVYRGLNIGTAKAAKEEMEGVPHYLIDCRDPEEPYSAGMFREMASKIIEKENAAGRIPVLVGGTGLYVQGLLEGYEFSPRSRFRTKYKTLYETEGIPGLERALQVLSPGYIGSHPQRDPQRMIRELELAEDGMREHHAGKNGTLVYAGPVMGLHTDRKKLYDRINARVDRMMAAGLSDEVDDLLRRGVPPDAQSLRGIGYKEMIACLNGQRTREETVELIKRNTRRFAKRQMTWFRRMHYIRWFKTEGRTADIIGREMMAYIDSYWREYEHGNEIESAGYVSE